MTGLIPFRRNFLSEFDDMDRWFDQFFDGPWFFPAGRRMCCDIKELEDKYVLEIDLPGMKKEDIDIRLEDGVLTVTARKEEGKEEDGKYIVKERRNETLRRSFRVGNQIAKDDVKASFENGVLTLTIRKKGGEPKDTKIEVK